MKCWFLRLECTKCLSEYQTGKTMVRLFLQKQSDLGLCCLPRPSVRNFRTFTINPVSTCIGPNFLDI